MKSRGVGFLSPSTASTRSRSDCVPVKRASSASVNGSSSGFEPKSKLVVSDSSISESTSSGRLSMSANLSSASALVGATTGWQSVAILQVLGIAAEARGVGLELGVAFADGLEIRVAGEDQLTPARGEAASAAALPGLDDDRDGPAASAAR